MIGLCYTYFMFQLLKGFADEYLLGGFSPSEIKFAGCVIPEGLDSS